MTWYQNKITKRLRQVTGSLPSYEIAASDGTGGDWTLITDAAAAADVRYVQRANGSVISIGSADLPAAVTAGGTAIDATTAKAANPQLFGKADPAVLQAWRPSALDAAGNPYVPSGDPTQAPNYPQSPQWTGS